ncbi:AAA family ATPase [Roseovarius arcticus]|uniref:bifunctional aminoglycoside phosphotransferase/ATP-binding protein n=1 Tax=Roseovarius arcticus TaxID=2547404 RepID=UPI0011106F8A|nr:bifunctional aminoglycoside phosphotransferase/ATP-binding protein [Roseovarius arcticus]
MRKPSQDEVIAFLSDSRNLPGHEAVETVRTHGALVFLCGSYAYKIKRDVRYNYLDFSTLQKRHEMLLRELELNAPTAPSIYRDVIALTRDADGQLHLGGEGEVVEWVLRMQRFDTDDELDKVAARGALDDQVAERLGEVVAQYHAQNKVCADVSGADLIGAILDELNSSFATMTDHLDGAQNDRFHTISDGAYRRAVASLNARADAGHVRRCHGDLHLRNIVLIDGVPTPFDALEFDETLGTSDVLYDLAFLLMDLRHAELPRAANITLNSYLFYAPGGDHQGGNYAGLSLLPLFQSIRAAIRAMVVVQTTRVNPDDPALLPGARKYMSEALDYLAPAPAQLIAVGGASGTGKTVLAKSLCPQIGAAPGAVHLRSDLERKALFGVPPLTRLPPRAYGSEISRRVYDVMRIKAYAALMAGHSVVMDATWLSEDERKTLSELAGQTGAGFSGLWLSADTPVLQARVGARNHDASDADATVVHRQAQCLNPPSNWRFIDASGDPTNTFAEAIGALSGSAKPRTGTG